LLVPAVGVAASQPAQTCAGRHRCSWRSASQAYSCCYLRIGGPCAARPAGGAGGADRCASGAIEALETAIGRPVITSNQVLLWQLLADTDDTFEINGYGLLFAHKP